MARGDNFKGKKLPGKVPGSGRAPGTKNKVVVALEEVLASGKYAHLFEKGHFVGSLFFWLDTLQESNSFPVQNICAQNLAKYLNKAQPVLTESKIEINQDNSGFSINFVRPEEPKVEVIVATPVDGD